MRCVWGALEGMLVLLHGSSEDLSQSTLTAFWRHVLFGWLCLFPSHGGYLWLYMGFILTVGWHTLHTEPHPSLRPVLTNKNKSRRNLFLSKEVCPMQSTGHEPEGSSGMPISDPKAKLPHLDEKLLCEILPLQDYLMEQAGLQAVSTLRHPGGSPDVSAHIAEEMKLGLGIH